MLHARSVLVLALTAGLFGCPPSGPQVPPVILSFTASASQLPAGGGQVTLAWTESDATTLTIDNGVGNVSNRTTTSVYLSTTTTFTLTASNRLGSTQSSVTITVATPTEAPTITGFTASPASLGILGGTVNLLWSSANASTLFIDNGVGNVSGRSSISVTVTQTTTYTLTATNSLGTVTAQATVTVQVPAVPPSIQSFTASSTNLEPGGGWVTLSWQTSDAQTLVIDNGVGSVIGRSSIQVRVNTTTAFKLIATNVRGSAQSIVLVQVQPQPMPQITSFYTTPSSIPMGGGYVTFHWSTQNADTIFINNGVGDVTWEFGSAEVWVNYQSTFTLSASNNTGTVQTSLFLPYSN